MSMEPTVPSVGARVKPHSLQQKPEHNGVEREVLEFDASAGQRKVQLHPDGLMLAPKASNLAALAPAELMGGADVKIHSLVRTPALNGVRVKDENSERYKGLKNAPLCRLVLAADTSLSPKSTVNGITVVNSAPAGGHQGKPYKPDQYSVGLRRGTPGCAGTEQPTVYAHVCVVRVRAWLHTHTHTRCLGQHVRSLLFCWTTRTISTFFWTARGRCLMFFWAKRAFFFF